jgi:hypothetical protein
MQLQRCSSRPILLQLLLRSAFPLSNFAVLPATCGKNWSLFHYLDQIFKLRVVMNINEKKYGLPLTESLRHRKTSYEYDRNRGAAAKSTDDVVIIKTVSISAYYVVRRRAQCEYSG